MIFDEIDPDDFARIAGLPMVPFCEALLDRFGKASSADLHAAWTMLYPDAETPKTEFKRVRDAWKERRTSVGTVAEGETAQAQQTADARAQAWAQLEVAISSGNAKKQAELVKVIKALDEMAPERLADGGTEKLSLLEPGELDCLLYLVAKANGQPLDEDGEWFAAFLARVPERPYAVHPAHLPLPEAPRPAMLTP